MSYQTNISILNIFCKKCGLLFQCKEHIQAPLGIIYHQICNKFKNGPNPISWHHLNPNEKSFQISYSNCGGKSDEEIQTEINKCIPLCNKCHTKIHGCMKKMIRLNKNLTALTVSPEQWRECGL